MIRRQQLKAIKNMGLPELRKWLLAYSWNVYNIGVADCKDALRKEFGFGEKRLKRMTDYADELCRGQDGIKAYLIGCAAKYIYRYPKKNGLQDLDKAIECLKMLRNREAREASAAK